MKYFSVATRDLANLLNGNVLKGVAIAFTGLGLASCAPKAEEPSAGLAVVQPTVYSEPLVKPTTSIPTPTPDPKAKTPQPKATKKAEVTVKTGKSPTKTTSTMIQGMRVIDVRKGTGAEAVAGKTVIVDYRGTLLNGTQFDASYDRGEPFSFPLGAGQVIKGWDLGVAGMKVGGKRRLIIPPDLGYGAQGAGGAIPPNATLIFEVELKAVQ